MADRATRYVPHGNHPATQQAEADHAHLTVGPTDGLDLERGPGEHLCGIAEVQDFRAGFRGREILNAEPLDAGRIRQVGLLITAKRAGPFSLAIRRIALI